MSDKIKVGDIVMVNFNSVGFTLCASAEVVHIPCATGDSWVFKDCADGDVHHVSELCTVTKRARG